MVKKRLASGEPCGKCVQAEDQLKKRGLWDRVDKVVWADESDKDGLGWALAQKHNVSAAPFFLVGDAAKVEVYTSTLSLIRDLQENGTANTGKPFGDVPRDRFEGAEPLEIVRWALDIHGKETAIAFSGAEDVVLIHMAIETRLPFAAVTLDTGRLHPETYEFIDWVREKYAIELIVTAPDHAKLEGLVSEKGLFSFYRDGHAECCAIRKVEPLRRALAGRPAWITGQRRDQSSVTRGALPIVETDRHLSVGDANLVKVNPLAEWTAEKVWDYIRTNEIPHNPLHGRGFASIGCAPCTRPVLPGQSPREGRWWWEGAETKECGLHAQNLDATPTPD